MITGGRCGNADGPVHQPRSQSAPRGRTLPPHRPPDDRFRLPPLRHTAPRHSASSHRSNEEEDTTNPFMPLADSDPEHPPVQDSQFDHASENCTAMSNSPAEVDGDTWFNFVRGMQSPLRRDQIPHPTQQQLPTHLRNLPYEASAQEEKWKEDDNVGEVAEGEINNMTKGK